MDRRRFLLLSRLLVLAPWLQPWLENFAYGMTGDEKQFRKSQERFLARIRPLLESEPDASWAQVAQRKELRGWAEQESLAHLAGPVLGCLSLSSATVWLRTLQPAEIVVEVEIGERMQRFGPVKSTLESDLTAVVPITGLTPGVAHPYRVLVDDRAIELPGPAAIRTPSERTGQTRVAFGACSGSGWNPVYDVIRERSPAAMIMLGDNVYHDSGKHRGKQRLRYARDLEFTQRWRLLTANVPIYATWDDHDYLGSNSQGLRPPFTEEDRVRSWEVFHHTWNNPSYGFGADDGRGVFSRGRVGPCDVILLDNRYFAERGKRGQSKLIGDRQMEWLEKQLLDCKGPFIILGNGTMWTDHVSGGKESWGAIDQAGRERIFNFIEKNRIAGVLLISGDRHMNIGFRIPRPSGYTFYEFEPAKLHGGFAHPDDGNDEAKKKRPSYLDSPDLVYHSTSGGFGEFTFDTAPSDPTVTFRIVHVDGDIAFEKTLSRSELTPLA